jgi:uncharacterized membrane protein HdeD (DUF308 family)
MGIFSGVLGILAGIVAYVHAVMCVMLIGFLISFLGLLHGISGIMQGIRLRKEIDNEWSMILGGLISAIFGVLLLISPKISAAGLLFTAGIVGIVGGISLIFLSFRIREFGKEGFPQTA